MKRGRPLKYPSEEELLKKTNIYLQGFGHGQGSLPSKEGLALYLDLNDETITEYRKIYPNFSATCKKLEIMQKQQLMEDGMYGGKEVNSTMAIFLLKANHGMVETEKRILTGEKDEPLQIEFVESKNE